MRALWFFSILLLNLSTAKAAPPLPIAFVENHGQAPVGVRFMAKGSGLTAFFAADEAVLRLTGSAVRMRFEGADRGVLVEGGEKLPGHANFLIGASENWVLGSALYGSIVYRDLYPGIDMTYGANGRELKSEFLVHPGADLSRIRIRYSGAGDVHVDGRGSLVIPLNSEELREDPPVVYQEKGGRHVAVEGAFAVNDDGSVGFTIAGYDAGLPLVIDPVIKYSTLLGGSSSDAAIGVAVDSAGAAYIAGYTASYDFPMQNPVQNLKSGSNDVFIAKLNSSGTGLIYSTYLGGSGDDQANGIAVDGAGSVYVTGSTTSTNFPMRNALQARLAGQKNAFALKLSPAGNSLVYSTYLGGNGSDSGNGIAVDTTGNAYVVGDTSSITFPATGVQKGNRGSQDAFVAKLSTDGSRLVYSTYLGGSNVDHGAAIAVDASGAAYITGSTYSTDFPTASPFQVSNGGGQDAFVAKLSADGSSLVYSTYLGGSGGSLSYPEQGQGIAVDAQGNAYITGATSSANFPVMLPFQSTLDGWEDAFLAKLNPTGWPVYSTYLGGSGVDCANAIAVDATGSVYIVGYTYSTDLPVVDALQPSIAAAGNMDAFVAVLAPSGNSLSYLSYLGGTGSDTATSVALDSVGGVYVAGWTLSANFPLVSPVQSVNGGNYGAFVMKATLHVMPVNVGATPNSGSGSNQTFTAQFSDSNGIGDLTTVSMLINTSAAIANACSVTYDRARNALFLMTDAGNAPVSGIIPGAGSQQNGQCTLDGAGSSVSVLGTALTVKVSLAFKNAFAGDKNIYLASANPYGSTGWQARGVWTVPTLSAVTAISVTPASGSGSQQVFAVHLSDSLGATDLSWAWVVFTSTLGSQNSCPLFFTRSTKQLALYNDSNSNTVVGTLGGSGSISNSQCSVNLQSAAVTTSETDLVLTLPMAFSAAYAGGKSIYVYGGGTGMTSGWQTLGTWVIPSGALVSALSVTPASGSGSQQVFAVHLSDSLGATDLSWAWVVFTSTLGSQNSCPLFFTRSTKQLALYNDSNSNTVVGTLGGSGSISNSQCSVNLQSAAVTTSETDLVLTLPMAFSAAYAGGKSIYVYGGGTSMTSGWQTLGTWTVSSGGAVSGVSVTPALGNGLQQTFAVKIFDNLGATDLNSMWVVFTSTLGSQKSCPLFYTRGTNQLALYDDGNSSTSVGTVGGSGSISNSQCSVNLQTASVVLSGSDLILNLPMIFATGYAGTKSVYVYGSGSSTTSGWQTVGTWIVP